MAKFKAVFSNEMRKIFHKKYVTLMIVLVYVVTTALGLVLSAGHEYVNDDVDAQQNYENAIEDKRELGAWLDEQDEIFAANGVTVLTSTTGMFYLDKLGVYARACTLIEEVEEYGLGIMVNDYRREVLDLINMLKRRLICYDRIKDYTITAELKGKREIICPIFDEADRAKNYEEMERLETGLSVDGFAAYIEMKKQDINDPKGNPVIGGIASATNVRQKAFYRDTILEILDIMLEQNITGEYPSHAKFHQDAGRLVEVKWFLHENIKTFGGDELTADTRKALEDEAATIENKMHSGYYNRGKWLNDEFTKDGTIVVARLMLFVGSILITLLVMIIAAGIISKEIETGAVKMLIIVPVKRWKIYSAKVLSLALIATAMTAVLAGWVIVLMGIVFGFGELHLYTSSWGVLSFEAFVLLYALLQLLSTLWYMMVAVSFSTIIRNTAGSITAGIGLLVLSLVGMIFGDTVMNPAILSYVPSICASTLADSVLPHLCKMTDYESIACFGVELGFDGVFTLCYVAVLLVGMVWSARDSFCRRDIK